MIYILTTLHVIVCLFLILVVLLQQGKGADLAGTFGGGGSQTVFGARGAGTLLSRATTAAAIIFMITSLSLTIAINKSGGTSVIREGAKPTQSQPAPVTPDPSVPGTPAPEPTR